MSEVFQKYIRYWNTLRYLKPVQIFARFMRRLKRVNIDLSEQPGKNTLKNNWVQSARRDQRMVEENAFCFLNETHEITSSADWNNDQWAKLWLYNLHYFDDLTANNSNQRVGWHRGLVQRWVNDNPPGEGNGWDPYPSSLRIVNWIKWELAGNKLEESWEHSLAIQIRYLSKNLEIHLLGNHIFANAKALLFAGLFFRGEEADLWYKIGLKIVNRELPEQVLSDGGNFELSTMYHAIFLEDLLDLVNIHRAFGRKLPSGIKEKIPVMFNWLNTMCHPDGEISFFNDAAFGVAPSVKEIRVYGDRLSFFSSLRDKREKGQGASNNGKQQNGLINLHASGYSRVAVENAVALIDRASVGPDYLPSHAHADTLSFELSLFGQRVIVNSGTSVYGVGEERQRQRGTAAHATVVVDGENSSEVWGGFRTARRARVFNCESDEQGGKVTLSACHNGYHRISGIPTHCREWQFSERSLIIKDRITGKGEHDIDVVFPLHPKVNVINVDRGMATLEVSRNEIKVGFDGIGFLELKKSTYHPEFGLSIENHQLLYHLSGQLPVKISTRICW